MGRIKTAEIKRASFNLVQAYPEGFTKNFEKNKAALTELKIVIESKHTRNQLAGYITRIMRTRATS